MLVKKLSEKDNEVKYHLTMELATVAKRLGMATQVLSSLLQNTPTGGLYGTSGPESQFLAMSGKPRVTRLDDVHLRVVENPTLDASGSLITATIVVMKPGVVGELTTGDSYLLVPQVMVVQVDSNNTTQSTYEYQPKNPHSPAGQLFIPGEWDGNLSTGTQMNCCQMIVGWDLVLVSSDLAASFTKLIETIGEGFFTPQVVYDFGFGVTLTIECLTSPTEFTKIYHVLKYRHEIIAQWSETSKDTLSKNTFTPATMLNTGINVLNDSRKCIDRHKEDAINNIAWMLDHGYTPKGWQ